MNEEEKITTPIDEKEKRALALILQGRNDTMPASAMIP